MKKVGAGTVQGDLFSAKKAKDAKLDGMSRVEAHADQDWKDAMYGMVVRVSRTKQYFTADDVFLFAALCGMVAETHDYRAFGPVMLRAARNGICRKANRPPVNSIRASLHASPRQVWESLNNGNAVR